MDRSNRMTSSGMERSVEILVMLRGTQAETYWREESAWLSYIRSASSSEPVQELPTRTRLLTDPSSNPQLTGKWQPDPQAQADRPPSRPSKDPIKRFPMSLWDNFLTLHNLCEPWPVIVFAGLWALLLKQPCFPCTPQSHCSRHWVHWPAIDDTVQRNMNSNYSNYYLKIHGTNCYSRQDDVQEPPERYRLTLVTLLVSILGGT